MDLGAPRFRRFGVEDIGVIRRVTESMPPYTDSNPLTLLTWNTTGEGELAVVNGNLAFKLPEYGGEGMFLTFVGTHQVAKTVRQLLAYARTVPEIHRALIRVPEPVVRHVAGLRDRFLVRAEPDDFDYVFGVADMAAIAGSDYGEKRGEIRLLQRETAPELRQIDARDPAARALILALFDRWAAAKGVDGQAEARNERLALERFLTFGELSGERLIVLALFDAAGEPIGFCSAEVLEHGYAMGHFEKTDPDYPGASPLLRQRLAQYLLARGCRYLNADADLGEPGLRASKRSWRPRFFLRKYTITER